jgi:hypothetical protein
MRAVPSLIIRRVCSMVHLLNCNARSGDHPGNANALGDWRRAFLNDGHRVLPAWPSDCCQQQWTQQNCVSERVTKQSQFSTRFGSEWIAFAIRSASSRLNLPVI